MLFVDFALSLICYLVCFCSVIVKIQYCLITKNQFLNHFVKLLHAFLVYFQNNRHSNTTLKNTKQDCLTIMNVYIHINQTYDVIWFHSEKKCFPIFKKNYNKKLICENNFICG